MKWASERGLLIQTGMIKLNPLMLYTISLVFYAVLIGSSFQLPLTPFDNQITADDSYKSYLKWKSSGFVVRHPLPEKAANNMITLKIEQESPQSSVGGEADEKGDETMLRNLLHSANLLGANNIPGPPASLLRCFPEGAFAECAVKCGSEKECEMVPKIIRSPHCMYRCTLYGIKTPAIIRAFEEETISSINSYGTMLRKKWKKYRNVVVPLLVLFFFLVICCPMFCFLCCCLIHVIQCLKSSVCCPAHCADHTVCGDKLERCFFCCPW